MNRRFASVLAVTVAAAGLAHADASGRDVFPSLYGDTHLAYLAPDPTAARAAAGRVAEDCIYSIYSRIGPRPGEVARCNSAETRLLALGSDGARAAFEAIDRKRTPSTSRARLYGIVGRIGDPATVETLVAALGKLGGRGFDARAEETALIAGALQGITYAALGERAPFERWVEPEPIATATAWRGFLSAHRGMTRAELWADRVAEARAKQSGKDLAAAFLAAQFLARQRATHGEGAVALRALRKRPNLSEFEREHIDEAVRESAAAPPPSAPPASERRV